MDNDIVIVSWEGFNVSEEQLNDNSELSFAIKSYFDKKLRSENIELFETRNNVIITEKGCYAAFFEKDLEKA